MKPSDHKAGDRATPQHNELSLYLIGASMIALLTIDAGMRHEVGSALVERNLLSIVPFLGFCLLFVGQGLIFTIVHLFTHSRKNTYEVFCMVFFAVFVNAASGIAACIHIFTEDGFRLLLVFPVWNMISSLILLTSVFITILGGGSMEHLEVTVGEQDATPTQLALGSVILACLIGLCQYAFHLHWAITLSICVIYASHFDRFIQQLAQRHPNP